MTLKIENKEKRTIITFDVGSKELKDRAIIMAKEFQPIKISLSSLCQLALREYLDRNSGLKQLKKERR